MAIRDSGPQTQTEHLSLFLDQVILLYLEDIAHVLTNLFVGLVCPQTYRGEHLAPARGCC